MRMMIIKTGCLAAVAVVAFGGSIVSAQETRRVETLDVAKVFKEYGGGGFGTVGTGQIAQLKAEISKEKDRIKAGAAKLQPEAPSPECDQKQAELDLQLTRLRITAWESALKLVSASKVISAEVCAYFETIVSSIRWSGF